MVLGFGHVVIGWDRPIFKSQVPNIEFIESGVHWMLSQLAFDAAVPVAVHVFTDVVNEYENMLNFTVHVPLCEPMADANETELYFCCKQ